MLPQLNSLNFLICGLEALPALVRLDQLQSFSLMRCRVPEAAVARCRAGAATWSGCQFQAAGAVKAALADLMGDWRPKPKVICPAPDARITRRVMHMGDRQTHTCIRLRSDN